MCSLVRLIHPRVPLWGKNMCFYVPSIFLHCHVLFLLLWRFERVRKEILFFCWNHRYVQARSLMSTAMYHCHPFSSYPARVRSVQPPHWNTCEIFLYINRKKRSRREWKYIFYAFFFWPKVKLNKNLFCCSFAFSSSRDELWRAFWRTISFQNIHINSHLL